MKPEYLYQVGKKNYRGDELAVKRAKIKRITDKNIILEEELSNYKQRYNLYDDKESIHYSAEEAIESYIKDRISSIQELLHAINLLKEQIASVEQLEKYL